jgi:transcriptional regulator with XRE-family HTH domain
MLTHKQLVKKMLGNPTVKREYDALAEEFALFDALVAARARAGLSQADVARRMGTKVPAISRLESGGGVNKHSPSISTLRRYAKAVGCQLEVRLKPGKQKRAA